MTTTRWRECCGRQRMAPSNQSPMSWPATASAATGQSRPRLHFAVLAFDPVGPCRARAVARAACRCPDRLAIGRLAGPLHRAVERRQAALERAEIVPVE